MKPLDALVKQYKLETKRWAHARVNLYLFSVHHNTMKRFLATFTIVCAIAVLAGLGVLVATTPPREQSSQEKQFVAFANAYATAYNAHRLNKFEREVKGELVDWQGMITSVSPTGTEFDFIPNQGPNWSNGKPRLEAFVCLKNMEVPSHWHQGTQVRVRGKVSTCGVLSVIIEAKFVSEVL